MAWATASAAARPTAVTSPRTSPTDGELGHARAVGLAEGRRGRHHADGRVDRPEGGQRHSRRERRGGVDERAAVGRVASAGDEPAGGRIAHVAHRVDGDQGAHLDVSRAGHGDAQAALHRARRAVDLAHGGAGAGSHIPLGHGTGRGGGRGAVAHGAVGARAVIARAQVVKDGAGHVRHDRLAGLEADAPLLEVLHHAPDGLEAEGAAAGQHDAVGGRHQVTRVEELKPVDARGPAPDLDATHGGPVGEQHRAAGEPGCVGDVAHADAGDHRRVLRAGARLTSALRARPSSPRFTLLL